ncbi:hypothetical protein QWZ13_04950 [Reinekea marina]|uniref:hypothetical protein n=1 Tax=Reinekea marina TaxID=1310421 RepID=UPI0025B40279|nr:hypothetical protein [Reinekea marina]MDN3648255.1 hypothetical protein [Reinekea marina]
MLGCLIFKIAYWLIFGKLFLSCALNGLAKWLETFAFAGSLAFAIGLTNSFVDVLKVNLNGVVEFFIALQ